MKKRRFGKTDAEVTIVNIGGCGPGYAKDQKEADEAMQLALDAGINMVDCAPSYGDAENRLRPWMESYRDDLFLAEKTTERTKENAWNDMQGSFKRLGVDKFDLYQFHAVASMKELDEIFAPGGAMEAVLEAKESDMIEYIGITGHDDMRVFIEALNRFDFDTVLAPVSLAYEIDPHPANDYNPLLELAIENDVGIQAIKSIAKRRWKDQEAENRYKTWYEPFDEQEKINKALWYTLAQDGVSTAPMSCDVSLWPMIIKAAEEYSAMTQNQIDEIIAEAKNNYNMRPLFPYTSN